MESTQCSQSLPFELGLKIASCLPVKDVCALGSCSKYWRELCGSDDIWVSLCKQRWPSVDLSDRTIQSHLSDPPLKMQGWRGLYVERHNEMENKASTVAKFVEKTCSASSSLEVRDYLDAIDGLCSAELSFQDIQMFLLKPEHNVMLNLVGLHYCIDWLCISPESAVEALVASNLSERRICVKWWKVGRWFYGFRLKDEFRNRVVSLNDLAAAKEAEILRVLQKGTIYEVIRVQVSVAVESVSHWVNETRSSHSRLHETTSIYWMRYICRQQVLGVRVLV